MRRLSLGTLLVAGNVALVLVALAVVVGAAVSGQRDLVRPLVLLSVLAAAGALLASIVIARGIVRPLRILTGASSRIGSGDLETPIPRAGSAEIVRLAGSMEQMRSRLSAVTAELRGRKGEAESVLAGIVEGVFAVDRQRRIRYLNPQAAAMLGVSLEDVAGRFCGDLLNPQGPGGVRPCEEICPIIDARFRGSARASETLLLPGGVRRTVVITSATSTPPAALPEGEDARQFQVLRDETEIEATRRARDAVLANISHEFRTPLSAQLASIEMLRHRLGEVESTEVRDLVLALERGALRLTRLIDNLLESVRIDAGLRSVRMQPLALDQVLEEAVELTAPLIDQRGQSLDIELPYPLPPVSGDAPRLAQVFVNLLANANKFAPSGSAIRIGGMVDRSEVTIFIEDEGPGLPAVGGASLFDRFVRTSSEDADEEPEPSGMGLGLWIVKSIVERHGGRVEARDVGRQGTGNGHPAERGTRFSVTLPRADP